jgi:hypothetical protein
MFVILNLSSDLFFITELFICLFREWLLKILAFREAIFGILTKNGLV